ncbi:MAG: hypothetical protein A2X25_08610 [Chloroflexi bacterium GWB2_49_20]|nr:MAG: hypothetical protein A2X25_08610 [Chloroflexi bacterium GWB2_49_20]OGN79503.1 MAG: hypothetical protein A2X26_05415 [Chloroflexi bacterium GWC2_49_37]OGN84574.1 MAG: hypothetical protein A2X27_11115 [Chloroflexi bacterium GWD2_49_16]HCC78804.1 hypothetical protein [Anaerolineae bacterium]HCM97195.1 hypothetical protein [Anaerolineae bacterium]
MFDPAFGWCEQRSGLHISGDVFNPGFDGIVKDLDDVQRIICIFSRFLFQEMVIMGVATSMLGV